jgi:hypothetical protein
MQQLTVTVTRGQNLAAIGPKRLALRHRVRTATGNTVDRTTHTHTHTRTTTKSDQPPSAAGSWYNIARSRYMRVYITSC